jgi:hypothetical protein
VPLTHACCGCSKDLWNKPAAATLLSTTLRPVVAGHMSGVKHQHLHKTVPPSDPPAWEPGPMQ